ncbi:P-loop containing nucleoside triphosphate hydrolase protein [Echria macrotheca]|uniref:Origin recognition complex subunit 1 n=1 Tax=Echria macrotheca TaxID=438768 RepID=A0AAJ0BGY1_9PEZI|nr:P-loop containing nucleoside triphosphate hydrolase protein [Echria macrotheca]
MPGRVSRRRRAASPTPPPGVRREDSDDELGTEDQPWEWVYAQETDSEPPAAEETEGTSRKRKRAAATQTAKPRIIGARMGNFECRLGDIVLLKAEGSNEAWVGIIKEFIEDEEEGEMTADFLWFISHKEIHNRINKRNDYLDNELYITTTSDINPLVTINGKANIMSEAAFAAKYPTGKIPRRAKEYGKTFICRRGCNTKTCTYTDELVWEDVYRGYQDVESLANLVKQGTKATRRKQKAANDEDAPEKEYNGTGDADDGDDLAKFRTPSKRAKFRDAVTPGSRRKGAASKPVTPSSHRKIMVKKHLEFTPLATRILSPAHVQSSPYQVARSQLHVASVPTSLPCRESEFSLVYSHLEAAITDGTGTCIYISGTPGTGKTATVREVVAHLDAAVRADELDDFIFVEINGMKITDPHQSYALLWEALKGQRVSPAQALDLLEREFSHPSPRRVPCVVLMDELDQLVTKNQGVMYNFFNWPGLRHSRLIVLAVANTMDLPERTLSNKISSRLGLTRITFPGYNHEQLMRIVQSRLEGVPGAIVDADAVQFAARKVAAVSGDARRALDICRRAVELAEADAKALAAADNETAPPDTPSKKIRSAAAETPGGGRKNKKGAPPSGRVTIETIRRAIAEATSNPLQQYLRTLPFASRLLLAALLMRIHRTGLAESTYGDVLEEMQRTLRQAAGESRPVRLLLTHNNNSQNTSNAAAEIMVRQKLDHQNRMPRPAGLSVAAVDLTGAGIIHLEGLRAERPSKIRLAVGDEEVRLAFRDDPEIRELGVVL